MTNPLSTYQHKQRAPLGLLLYVLGWIAALVTILTLPEMERDVALLAVLLPCSLVFALAPAFHFLMVRDEGERLRVAFGPLPLFKTAIAYSDITDVEVDQTTWLDGWGIHMSLRGGWVWNIWGWDCVKITRKSGVIRVGTDDPARLAEFLKSRCPQLAKSQPATSQSA